MQLLLTGDPIDARRAYELGFVNTVVPNTELHESRARARGGDRGERAVVGGGRQADGPHRVGRRRRVLRAGRGALGARLPQRGRAGRATGVPRASASELAGEVTRWRWRSRLDRRPARGEAACSTCCSTACPSRAGTPRRRLPVGRCTTRSATSRTSTTPPPERITDLESFARERDVAVVDIDAFTARVAARHRAMSGAALVEWLHRRAPPWSPRSAGLDSAARVPWYGPDMSVASAITARIMETWAHGQDIADGLGEDHPPTRALRHVAHLGARTMRNSFDTHGLPAPTDPVRVELVGPGGDRWAWGDERREQFDRGSRARLLPGGHAAAPRDRLVARRTRPGRRRVAVDRPGVRRPSRRRPGARPVQLRLPPLHIMTRDPRRAVRIANISGFYGDRSAAPREMLDGELAVDVLTGDYLAELTMLILWKARRRDPDAGYARDLPRTDARRAGDVRRSRGEGRGRTQVGSIRGRSPIASGSSASASAHPRGSRWSRATTCSTASPSSSGRACRWRTSTPG